MAKSLDNKEDVEKSVKATESGNRDIVKIPNNRTPWYILDPEYEDGFVHYVDIPRTDRKSRVVCGAGPEGGGFAPDECPICDYTLRLYNKAKELRNEGEEKKADKIKDQANDMRAQYAAQFIVVRGQRVRLQKPDKEGKKYGPEFDFSDDSDSPAEVGLLSLSEAQFKQIANFIKDNEKYPFIRKGGDLTRHVIWSDRVKSGNTQRVQFDIDQQETDPPELPDDIDLSEFDVGEGLQIDKVAIKKVHDILTGKTKGSSSEDTEEEVDEDSEDEVAMEEPSDEDLDDEDEVEEETEDEEPEEDEESDEEEDEDGDLDDIEDDDVDEEKKKTHGGDFEDDIPDEEPPAKKKKSTSTSKSGTQKKSASKKGKGKANL